MSIYSLYNDTDYEYNFQTTNHISWERFANVYLLECMYSYNGRNKVKSTASYRDGVIIIRSIKKRRVINLEDVYSCVRHGKTIFLSTEVYDISITTQDIRTAISFYTVFNEFIKKRSMDIKYDNSIKRVIKNNFILFVRSLPFKRKSSAFKVHPYGV